MGAAKVPAGPHALACPAFCIALWSLLQEYLAKAVSDMEAVAFEKKQLLSQWRSSLAAMQRRDTALEVGWGRGPASLIASLQGNCGCC